MRGLTSAVVPVYIGALCPLCKIETSETPRQFNNSQSSGSSEHFYIFALDALGLVFNDRAMNNPQLIDVATLSMASKVPMVFCTT
ncbi:hypothetical protein ABKN59_003899 [Abortiporus biennis]